MIAGLIQLVCFNLAGEAVVTLLGVNFPGALAGMLLMLAVMCVCGRIAPDVEQVSGAILRRIGLVFVPSAVGVSLHMDTLLREGAIVVVAIVGGTSCALIASAWLYYLAQREKQP
ncbi:MAG: CidA/LrgA family protein [Magnetospirillum sp.]|nr:CidA/LrgA family protein [Magnetospirillum sp.]